MTIGEKIVKLRTDNNMSQRELAEVLGIAQQSLCNYESSNRTLRPFMISKICKFFGVSADYLLGLSEIVPLGVNIHNACDFTGLDEYSIDTIKEAATSGKSVLIVVNGNKVKKIMETDGVIEWQV